MESKGLSFRSVLLHSLWTTLTGILFFSLATMKGHKAHNFGYINFFSISGTLLATLPWIIQLLVSFVVILLHKTKGYNLMWIVQSPKSSKENHDTNVVTISSSSPLSSPQVLKKGDKDEIEIRIVIGVDGPKSPNNGSSASTLGNLKEIEGGNNTNLLTNGSQIVG